MKSRGAIRRRVIGMLAGLIVGAVAVVSAPSANATDYPRIPPPEGVEIALGIVPGTEAYVSLRSEYWESSCYDGTCRYEHFFQLPEGATFVDAPIYLYRERSGINWWTFDEPALSDDHRSLQATWATSMVLRGPEQVLAKVRIDADVPDGTALTVVDSTFICTPAYRPGETCTVGLERSAGVIVVSALGVPVADALIAVPVLVLLGGAAVAVVMLKRRRAAQVV